MAETYDVYFGTPGNLVQIADDQVGLFIEVPNTLEYNVEYNWRIDATNEFGTTIGDVWSFTTLVFAPPATNIATLKRLVAASNNKVFYET